MDSNTLRCVNFFRFCKKYNITKINNKNKLHKYRGVSIWSCMRSWGGCLFLLRFRSNTSGSHCFCMQLQGDKDLEKEEGHREEDTWGGGSVFRRRREVRTETWDTGKTRTGEQIVFRGEVRSRATSSSSSTQLLELQTSPPTHWNPPFKTAPI